MKSLMSAVSRKTVTSEAPINFRRRRRETRTKTRNLFIKGNGKEEKIQMDDLGKELENQQSIELRRIVYQKYQVFLSHEEEEEESAILRENDDDTFKAEYEKQTNNKMFAVVEMDFNDRLKIDLEDHIVHGRIKDILVSLLIIKRKINNLALHISKHPFFEISSLIIVLANCITILIDNSSDGENSTITKFENFFFAFYLFELSIKIIAQGLVLGPFSYLRDGWNVLDFFIISTTILSIVFASYGFNLQSLKTFRVLRPLRTIAKIKKLQEILISLMSAMPLVSSSFMILLFFYYIYALAGLHMFSGLLLKRCYYAETGLTNLGQDDLCGNLVCKPDMVCGKLLNNPNYGMTSFDTILYSFLQVFQIVTMDSWTSIMYSIQKSFTNFVSFYFITLVIIGSFFLFNLTLAIIKVKFTESHKKVKELIENQIKKRFVFNFDFVKKKGVWVSYAKRLEIFEETKLKAKTKLKKGDFKMNSIFQSLLNYPIKVINQNRKRIFQGLKNEFGRIKNKLISGNIANLIGMEKILEKMKDGMNLFKLKDKRLDETSELIQEAYLAKIKPKYLTLIILPNEHIFEKAEILLETNPDFLNYKKKKTKNPFKMNSQFALLTRFANRHIYSLIKEFPRADIEIRPIHLPLNKSHFQKEIYVNHPKSEITAFSYLRRRADDDEESPNFFGAAVGKLKPQRKKTFNRPMNGESWIGFVVRKKEEILKSINVRIDVLEEGKSRDGFDEEENWQQTMEQFKRRKININLNWSGEDVELSYKDNIKKNNAVFRSLNTYSKDVWILNFDCFVQTFTKRIKRIEKSILFAQIVFLILISNGIFLCLEGIVADNLLQESNEIFLILFTVELMIKLISLGVRKYFNDNSNILDFLIVFLSIWEIVINNLIKDSFNSFRMLRCFRAIRIFRILRKLPYMKKIINLISKTMSSFAYIAGLLILFNFVYGLLGMDIFNNVTDIDVQYSAYKFDDFFSAFLTAFDILTLDSWTNVLIVGFHSDAGILTTIFYCVSWIFIGNFIFLNLFLAILLDGLDQDEEKSENAQMHIQNHQNESFSLNQSKSSTISSLLVNNNNSNSEQGQMEIMRQMAIKDYKNNDIYFLHSSPCEYSLFLFFRQNIIRVLCHRIVFNSLFESFIFCFIIISCGKLIVDTYIEDYALSPYLDIITTVVFGSEMMMKVIAKGLFWSKDSYLKENWNRLDCFIVFTSVLSYVFEEINMPFIKLIKILRVVRPLRFITKNIHLKLVVLALLDSLDGILNVSIVILLIFMIFAMLGVSIFRDRFGYCETLLNFNVSFKDCQPNNWFIYNFNFDNIVNAMFTLLVVATYDGWMPIVGVAANSALNDTGPMKDNNRIIAYIFFIAFIIVIPMFFMNLFIAVIFMHFKLAQNKTQNSILTPSQQKWVQLQKLIIELNPKYEETRIPTGIRGIAHKIVVHRYFEEFIFIIILASTICSSIIYENQSNDYESKIALLDEVFILIFAIEVILKMTTCGLRAYFYFKWNQFDFYLTAFSLFDIIVQEFFSKEILVFQLGPKILRSLRVLRVGRLLRVIKKFDSMIKILQTLMFSLPMTFNILGLLLLVFFIYTIIGCSVFNDVPYGDYIDEYVNFKNFLYGMMTLFKLCTGDDWSYTLIEIQKTNSYASFFFISFIIITQFVMTNLFILVLLQQFEEYHINANNPLTQFKTYVEKFRVSWSSCTDKYKGQKMHKSNLIVFFQLMDPPLGFKGEENIDYIAKFLYEMKINSDKEGFIYFNELLLKTMKNIYGPSLMEEATVQMLNELRRQEKNVAIKLEMKYRKKFVFRRGSAVLNTSLMKHSVNPLEQYLYFKLSFNTWKNFTAKIFQKAEKYIKENANENSDSSKEENDDEENIINPSLDMLEEKEEIESGKDITCDTKLKSFNERNYLLINED